MEKKLSALLYDPSSYRNPELWRRSSKIQYAKWKVTPRHHFSWTFQHSSSFHSSCCSSWKLNRPRRRVPKWSSEAATTRPRKVKWLRNGLCDRSPRWRKFRAKPGKRPRPEIRSRKSPLGGASTTSFPHWRQRRLRPREPFTCEYFILGLLEMATSSPNPLKILSLLHICEWLCIWTKLGEKFFAYCGTKFVYAWIDGRFHK